MEEQGNTVLVIDDEESIPGACYQNLSRKGYRFKYVSNCKRVISLVRQLNPGLVLLDSAVAEEDIIHKIFLIDPNIVIVETSEHATVKSAVDAMKLGASDYLPKPYTCSELMMKISHGMEKRNLLKKTQQLHEENKRIRENFVSIITHEMRSPLVAVEQYIEVLLGGFAGELQSKQGEILSKCKKRLQWLLSLVNEWLDMARIEDITARGKFEEIDIRNILDESIELVKIQAELKNINLEFEVPEHFPVIVGNHNALIHLFMNVYSNAIKYNCECCKVTTTAFDNKDMVSVRICDNGIGIPKEGLPFIFDEFFRVQSIRKKGRQSSGEAGTGLGLAIVKKIVDAHGGYIDVESKVDKGTCFTVYLPKSNSIF
ncbi:MAG: response regulator [Candidatus Latescibacteria bacterium]|nr:response regulator [Candidatus Latescibacterota bacterium]